MARNDPQVNLRMPAKLKDGLEKASVENNRSLTAEIVARLEQSMVGPKHPPNITVRLEALPHGSEPAEISLGAFFENFSRTVRESVAAVRQAQREARPLERASDSLLPNIDADDQDRAIAERAAENSRAEVRARNIREAEKLAQRLAERLSDKPAEIDGDDE